MSNLQIRGLSSNTLNEINEQETTQVIGGRLRISIPVQTGVQIGVNVGTIAGFVNNSGLGQGVNNRLVNFALT